MEWKNWGFVTFTERHQLPPESGIYIVACANDCVWYVGQARNLKARWAGKAHHRYAQLIRSNKKLCYKIYWKEFPINFIVEQEKYYIGLFKPELNGCKVKKYLPQQPQVEREIKRLLKVLNSPTFLFPMIRSVVAGEYEGEDGTRCIIVLINANDLQIIINSMKKRHSPKVRNTWTEYKTFCGKNEQHYRPKYIATYSFYNYRVEFVELANFIFYLEENPSERELYVGVIEVFGVQVKALKYLDIFSKLPLQEEYLYTDSEGKKYIRDLDYLNYRRRKIKLLRAL